MSARRARRAPVRPALVVGALLLVVIAVAVHLTMPAWYARWWYPLEYAADIRAQAAANDLPPDLLAAVIWRESRFDPSARSSQGAVGLMQVLPATAEWVHTQPGAPAAPPARLGEAEVNIAYGAWYLHHLLHKYGDDERVALAAYNGGETNVLEWLNRAELEGREFTLQDIPFPETREFVRSVQEARGIYRRVYAGELGSGT